MDGRPVSATIVPFLALAAVLVAGGAIVAWQTASGRPDLVRRSRDWSLAMTRRDLVGAEGYVDPRALLRPAGERSWRMLTSQFEGVAMRLGEVRVDGSREKTTFLVPLNASRASSNDGMPVRPLIVEWGRGADGLWYLEP